MSKRCSNCNKRCKQLQVCSRCKLTKYCGRDCQVAHWKDGHKSKCMTQEKAQEKLNEHLKDEISVVEKDRVNQNEEFSLTIDEQFPSQLFPYGKCVAYEDVNRLRTTDEELRERERSEKWQQVYNEAREGAEVHRQARLHLQKTVKPGMRLIDICERLEERVRHIIKVDGTKRGTAFPTGCSVNDCAAHYTPNPGDFKVLQKDDVVKFDFGTQVNGRIVDCAWTMAFSPKYDELLKAVRAATEAGIKMAGIDVRLCDIGTEIQEVMESHEVNLDGKSVPVKVVRNLNGHKIGQYQIHSEKTVPCARGSYDVQTRMEENEFYAIETFGVVNGEGWVEEDPDCSHYMINYSEFDDLTQLPTKNKKERKLLQNIQANFSTLAFCPRYMERLGMKDYEKPLRSLCKSGAINPYPPLSDIKGSVVAQFEQTLILKPTHKEILSARVDESDIGYY